MIKKLRNTSIGSAPPQINSGNWGKNLMAAHPQHSEEEATDMVKYILSLADAPKKALPLNGSVATTQHVKEKSRGYYVLRAHYTDKPQPATGALSGRSMLTLRHPKVEAEDADVMNNVSARHLDGTDMTFLANVQDGSYIAFRDIDLTGIQSIHFGASAREPGSFIEVRAGSPTGKLLGKADVTKIENFREGIKVSAASLEETREQDDVYFVFRNREGKKDNIAFVDWILFDNAMASLP